MQGRYFNDCNAIDNQNRIRQSDTALEKYWVTQSGYFRTTTTVELDVGITDGKLLYCHGVAEVNEDKKILTLEYKNRTVHNCFNNPFTDNFGIPDTNLPPINFDDRPRPHNRALYTSDMTPANVSVVSENSFSTLTTPYDYPDLLPSDDPNTIHVIKIDLPVLGRRQRGYCCRIYNKKDATKRHGSIVPHALIRTWNFIIVMVFTGLIQRKGIASWNINVLCQNVPVDCCVYLPSILYFTC